MSNTLTLKVLTPMETLFQGPAVSVMAPGAEGYLGILVNHAPLVTTLGKGNLTYRNPEGDTKLFQVEGGFLEVSKNEVLVLADKIVV